MLPGLFHHQAGKAALARCLSRNRLFGPRRARTRDVLGGRFPAPSGHGRLDTRAKPASWPIDGIGLSQGECLARDGYPPSIASRIDGRTFRPPPRASPPARAGTFPACPITEEMTVSHGVGGGGKDGRAICRKRRHRTRKEPFSQADGLPLLLRS